MINQPKPTPESELKDKANFFKLYLERGEILFKRDSEISSLKAECQQLRDKYEADRKRSLELEANLDVAVRALEEISNGNWIGTPSNTALRAIAKIRENEEGSK